MSEYPSNPNTCSGHFGRIVAHKPFRTKKLLRRASFHCAAGLERVDARHQRQHSGGHGRGFHGVWGLVKGPCHVHIAMISFDMSGLLFVSARCIKVDSFAASLRLQSIVVDRNFCESLCATDRPAPPLPAGRDFALRDAAVPVEGASGRIQPGFV